MARQPMTKTPMQSLGRVVLVHGLFMGRFAMRALAKSLSLAGFDVECFAYNTVTGSLDAAATRLEVVVGRGPQPVALVGHSLGGLVSLRASQRLSPAQLKAVVLLGCPYQGAAAARVLQKMTGGRRSRVGPALAQWVRLVEKPRASAPVFTLSGTRSAGLGRIVCGFREPNDGTVSVAETHYPGATSCVLPVSHTGMLFSAQVASQVKAWLLSVSR
jgi:pimeloyl-ACP methyl ester carboxylesterase